jgi:transcriptional regulator with XRE-family HTH domain
MHQIYQHWEAKSFTLPDRSRLNNLEPIGVGTIKVESLTGYVARLAATHCISNHTLLHKEVFGSKKRKEGLYRTGYVGFSSSLMNGVGDIAEETSAALERLTLCPNIPNSTMLKWKNILSPAQLLRQTRKWCPTCYEESIRKKKPVYEPLIFAFEAVSICPWHLQPLCDVCPNCKSQLPMLTSRSRPGYCSRCKEWLGAAIADQKPSGQQSAIVDSIGELLIRAPLIINLPTHRSFMANLTECIDRVANGSINTFAYIVGIWSGTIRRLVAGETKPRLEVLYRICSKVNLSLLDLMLGTENEEMAERRRIILGQTTPMPREPTPWIEVEGQLHEALQEFPPSSMEEVARRMGYYQPKIRYHFPELCAQIVSRYNENMKSKHPNPSAVRKVFRVALEEQPPPSLQSVLRRLGCRDTGYYYYHNYPDLCSAIAQRFKSYRNKPFNMDFEREQLEAALLEDPAPSLSAMAAQLGRTRDFLSRKFPELTKAIATRHVYYQTSSRKEKAQRLRDAIREAVKQLIASGLNISEARVRAHVIQQLPGPGNDLLFKSALREIKAEMSITN